MDKFCYKDILLTLPDALYAVSKKREILFWNEEAEKITGYKATEVIGKSCSTNMLCHVDSDGRELCAKGCPLESTIKTGEIAGATVFLHHKSGHRVPVSLKTFPLRDFEKNIMGAVEVFSLFTAQDGCSIELEKMRQKASIDRLTGVYNRSYGEATLDNVAFQSKNSDSSYGVLFIDIDHFKYVNDTWGHSAGDQVLKMVANSISSGLRSVDTISRWGGEEFIVVLPNVSKQKLFSIGERLRMLVEKSWLEYDGTTIKVTASLGGTIASGMEVVESVLKRADHQLYFSKDNGRNVVNIA